MDDRPSGVARCQDIVVLRMPFEAVYFLRVPLHRVQLAERANVEHPDKAISACGRHEVTLGVPVACVDDGFVRVSVFSQCAGEL